MINANVECVIIIAVGWIFSIEACAYDFTTASIIRFKKTNFVGKYLKPEYSDHKNFQGKRKPNAASNPCAKSS